MSQFRLPELGQNQQLQTFAPSVSNPTPMPVNNNKRLEQILGVINTAGTVAAAYAQNRYYDQVNKRTRLGIASGEGQDAASAIADQFATGTVPDEMLERFQSASPEDLPATIRQVIGAQAAARATEDDMPEDEREAFVEGYVNQAMRYALPWAKDLIETERGILASGMSADLRRPGVSVAESYGGEGGWSQNPSTSNLGWRTYSRNVVVPAMQTLAADNDFAGVERIYNDLAGSRVNPDGSIASRGRGESNLITPEIASIYAQARKQHLSQRMDEAKEHIGAALAGGLDDESREIAMNTTFSLIDDAGFDPRFAATFARAWEELSSRDPRTARQFASQLLIADGDDGKYRIPHGHPVREALRKVVEPEAVELSEAERTRLADTIMIRGLIAKQSMEDITTSLVNTLGETGISYIQNMPSLRSKITEGAVVFGLPERLNATVLQAESTEELDGVRLAAHAAMSRGDITPQDYVDLIDATNNRSERLPWTWGQYDQTEEFDKQLLRSFTGTSSDGMSSFGGSIPPERMIAFNRLRDNAIASWETTYSDFLDARADASTEFDSTVTNRFSFTARQRLWRQWLRDFGSGFLMDAANLKQE